MFMQPGNTSFGGFNTATQSSPFGQSAFAKPITTTSFGSGAAPVFGSSNTSLFSSKPTGSTTGGLFGNTTTSPAFRQPTNTQPSFGGFGTPNTSTNLFGTQQNANTNLFGTNTAQPTFGQTNKPGGFSFGTTSSTTLFGQPQQTAQQTTPFGQTSTAPNTNLFGTTSGFGSTTPATTMTGTVIKFTPVITTESMSKNGISHNISARHCCIASMKEYENKSYEELRYEDYQVGRKGPQGLFGTPAPSPFGGTAPGTSTSTPGFGGMTGTFGATSQSGSTGLFGKPMTSFGTPSSSTTNTFAFNSTPSNNLFATNTQAKPFGTAAPTPLFANTNTNQPAGTAFGGLNTTQNTGFASFGSTQPNQSIGLFNQNKSAFSVPSTSSGAAFSTFGQTPANNTGSTLFGAKPTGTTAFGATNTFGATAAPAFGTSTGFTAGQNTGSSLFNLSFKPAGQTSGFSFGSTTTPSTGLGTNTNLTLGGGTSLFGQQKPGGLFGTTTNNTTFSTPGFGSSAFGNTSTIGTGVGMNLLAGGSATNQGKPPGSVPVHQQILALVSAPFGDSPLLKNLLPASGKTEELLKPANAASRVLNSPQYKVTANTKSPKLKTRVVSAAQLSKKSLFEGLEEEDPVLSEAFQPRPNAKRLVLRPKPIIDSSDQSQHENSQLARNGSKEDRVDISVFENQVEATDKENHIQENNRNLIKDRRSTTSWLKSALPEKPHREEESFDGQWPPFSRQAAVEEAINNTFAELRPHANSLGNSSPQVDANHSVEATTNTSVAEKSVDITTHNSDSSQELEDSSFSALQTNWTTNAAKVTLRRVGYYTIPPLDKLDEYVSGETCIVPNFTVGRDGYGNVYFPDSFDIYGLNLDEIVHFRHKEVILYPDDEKKPPVGQGLNRKAQVTLDRVWPHDKSLHEPITDPHRLAAMNYEAKLRRVSAKHDTRFLDYRPETGSWVFKVDHFSKYGLSDSDEEEVPASQAAKVPNMKQKVLRAKALIKNDHVPNGEIIDDTKMTNMNHQNVELLFVGNSVISRPLSIGHYSHERELPVSPTGDHARIVGTDSHKLQLMKASFFDTNDDDIDGESNYITRYPEENGIHEHFPKIKKLDDNRLETAQETLLRSNLTIRHTNYHMYDEEMPFKKGSSEIETNIKLKQAADDVITEPPVHTKRLPDPVISPVTTTLKYHTEVIPLQNSIVNRLQSRCIADMGVQMGRKFKPSWGRGLTLITLTTEDQAANINLHSAFYELGSYLFGRELDDKTSTTVVQRLQILGGEGADEKRVQIFKESIEGHLRIQLANCVMGQEGECPMFDVSSETATAALHAHCKLAQELAEQLSEDRSAVYVASVWKLCVALWGNLPDINIATGNAEHHNVMVRREAIGEWLQNVVCETVEREIADVTKEEKILLLLLSALKLEEACETARKAGDHCLALLMAQLRSGNPVKKLVKQQIALWQETEVDANISMDRLKLYSLLAGEPLICSKHGTINVCEGLDWKRALAVHLWYLSPPTASIRDALELYQASFEGPMSDVYAAAPSPEYKSTDYDIEVGEHRAIYDLCFHLLKLYCTGDHVLGEVLNPPTHTADPLDYRLSWLMQQVLVALGYTHLPDDVAALIHTNFSTQLEAYGLWHWAIFVVLHLRDAGRRQTAVIDLLQRYVELDDIPEYVEREQFLVEELGIPSTWIHRAKAIKSHVNKRYGEAAWYYLKAEQWNAAHEVIIEHLAPNAIINDNYDYLRKLLQPLSMPECSGSITGWPQQGQLLWDYMEITKDIDTLLRVSDLRVIGTKIESLKQRLRALKINQFPCPTAKHRLCQAEIAKRTIHLVRNLLLLQSNETRSAAEVLARLVSQLPLPEDYAQQELRHMVNMRVNEVISQLA